MLIEITYNVTDVFMSTTETPVYVEISFEQPGGSAAVWGSITGTLSNQTDLQNALNAKFDDPTGTTTQYIDGTGALQTFPLTLPVLQEVRNQTGATLDAGTVVYINGATGNKPTVTKAIATGDATSAQTLGMISAAIANNGVGYVVVIGTCGGLDTSAYTEGQQLYLSGTVAGGVTTTKPYAPIHLVYVGIVTRSHPNLGTVEVRVQNGFEMDEIHNVSAQTPSNNDGLFYNTTTSLWESKAITTALGYTPVPTTRNITINGVTYDLSADRTWTISAGISGSGAAGQVTYWTGASSLGGSNDFFWDNANGRLGIGTNAPAVLLDVNGATTIRGVTNITYATPILNINVTANTQTSAINFNATDGNPRASITTNIASGEVRYFVGSGGYFATHYSNGSERMRLHSNGNFSIGTTSDLGVRLGVVGDTLLRGSGNTIATTALTVQNSSSTNLLRVLNNGDVSFGADAMFWDNANGRLGIGTNAPSTTLDIRGKTRIQASGNCELDFVDGVHIFRVAQGSSGGYVGTLTSQPLIFATGALERGRFSTNGNFSIGTTAELGRLGVVGDTILRGSGATSATTALTVQNSSSTNLFTVRNDGLVNITNTLLSSLSVTSSNFTTRILINNTNATPNAGFELQTNGVTNWALANYKPTATTNASFVFYNQRTSTDSFFIDGDTNNVGIRTNAPTARLDIPASVTTAASLRIRSGTAPTSPNNGDIWFDGTDIKMRIGGVTKTFTLL